MTREGALKYHRFGFCVYAIGLMVIVLGILTVFLANRSVTQNYADCKDHQLCNFDVFRFSYTICGFLLIYLGSLTILAEKCQNKNLEQFCLCNKWFLFRVGLALMIVSGFGIILGLSGISLRGNLPCQEGQPQTSPWSSTKEVSFWQDSWWFWRQDQTTEESNWYNGVTSARTRNPESKSLVTTETSVMATTTSSTTGTSIVREEQDGSGHYEENNLEDDEDYAFETMDSRLENVDEFDLSKHLDVLKKDSHVDEYLNDQHYDEILENNYDEDLSRTIRKRDINQRDVSNNCESFVSLRRRLIENCVMCLIGFVILIISILTCCLLKNEDNRQKQAKEMLTKQKTGLKDVKGDDDDEILQLSNDDDDYPLMTV